MSDTAGYVELRLMSRYSDVVWSMPGGFTSAGGRDGYQSVDDPAVSVAPPPKHSAPPPPVAQPNQNAYQSV